MKRYSQIFTDIHGKPSDVWTHCGVLWTAESLTMAETYVNKTIKVEVCVDHHTLIRAGEPVEEFQDAAAIN